LRPAARQQNITWHCDGAVGDDEDFEGNALERMPLGNAINLLPHRAGVGVDVESYEGGHWFEEYPGKRSISN
jgi:hypothetical protein